jgi:hypothetical protein
VDSRQKTRNGKPSREVALLTQASSQASSSGTTDVRVQHQPDRYLLMKNGLVALSVKLNDVVSLSMTFTAMKLIR